VSALVILLGASSPAQACDPPELTWAKRAGGGGFENAEAVARAGDGWVVCGSYGSVATFGAGEANQAQLASTGARDAFVAAYGPDGALRWARTTSGSPSHWADGMGVAANSSGQIFVTGIFSGSVTFGSVELVSQGLYDSFVASYDANGALLWARHVTGPGAEDATSVCVLGTGSIVVAGRFDQTATFHGSTSTWTVASAGQHDAFYAVFTTDGALSLARGEGGAGDEAASEVIASADGSSFAIAGQMIGATTFGLGHGTTTTFNSSVWSAFVSSYTPTGTLRWVKRVSHSGGGGGSFARGLTTLGDGSVVATGQVSGSATFGPGEANETMLAVSTGTPNVFLARYGPDGQLAWARRDGGGSFAYGWSVSTAAGDDLLVAGGFEGSPAFGEGGPRAATLASNGGRDGFVARYSAGGSFLWAQRVGGTQVDEARGVASTGTGEAVLLGTFNGSVLFDSEGGPGTTGLTSAGGSDVFLARYVADATGVQWARATTGGNARAQAVGSMADGSSVVTGVFFGTVVFGAGEISETTLTTADRGAFIARYAADGALLWARAVTGSSWVTGYGISGHADGSLVVVGDFLGSAVFGPGEISETTLASPANGVAAFVARYRADGTFVWARATGSSVNVHASGVAVYADGSSIVTGNFSGAAVFGTGETGEVTLMSPAYEAAFVARYSADGVLAWARPAVGSWHVFSSGVAGYADGSSVVTGRFLGTAVFGAAETAEATLVSTTISAFIARYAADGSLLWARVVSAASAFGLGVAGHPDGSSVVTGGFSGTAVIGSGEAGETTLAAPQGTGASFIARHAPDGTLLWARALTSRQQVEAFGVAAHPDGSSVVVGRFDTTVVFRVGEQTETTLSSHNNYGMFVAMYGTDGELIWARAATGTGGVDGRGVATHADRSSVVAGVYWGSAALGSGEAGEIELQGAGAFIARYAGYVSLDGPGSVVVECAGDDATEVVFDLQVAGCTDDASLMVTDVTHGRTLFSGPVISGARTMGPHVFPDGVSIVEAEIRQGATRVAFDSFTVQIADTTTPLLEGCEPATLELQGPLTTLFKSMLGIKATDGCDPAPTVTFGPAAVPLGTTDVLVTAEDATGNATTCTIAVTIVDTTPPVFDVAPVDIDRECVSGSVIVNFDILATDLSGSVALECTDETARTVDPAGTTFDDGVHTVTCFATDGSGNSAIWSFTITVSDNTAPAILVPDDITVTNEPGESFAFVNFSVAATDNCDLSVPIVCTTPFGEVQSGDAFPVGLAVVICTARDVAGNEATAAFQILVRDVEPPVLTCPAAVELHTDTVGTPLAVAPQDLGATATDNWDPAPVVFCAPAIVPVGTTAVTVTARDADGNEITCTVDVTVLLTGQETTQTGTDVVVAPETQLPDGSTATVTVSFDQVSGGGVTTVTTSDAGQPLPNGFKLGNPPIYYDVSTTAQFGGTAELCFTWQEGQIANESNARLFHLEGGSWVDVTTSVDTANNIICGAVTSLSPFAIVEQSYTFGGILQPIADDGSSIFKRGRVVPVKVQLFNPDGTDAADAVVRLKLVKISNSVLGTVEEEIDPATVGSANTDNLFRYDAGGRQFIYNLATSGLTAGTYRLEIVPDDGSRYTMRISVRD
jgi:hypothetical protein